MMALEERQGGKNGVRGEKIWSVVAIR
jgi:hypothetical protein